MRAIVIPILYEDAPIVQEIKNEPPRAPSTPRNKELRDLAQLHKETVLLGKALRTFAFTLRPSAFKNITFLNAEERKGIKVSESYCVNPRCQTITVTLPESQIT